MEYIADNQIVVVFSKKIGLETIAAKLSELNAEQIYNFFINREIKLPRRLNSFALISVLNSSILKLNSHSLNKESFAKLDFYNELSDYQLTSIFNKICDSNDYVLYRRNLWKLIIVNCKNINLHDGEIQKLINLKKESIEDFDIFVNRINQCAEDLIDELDCIPQKKIETNLLTTYSQDEIKGLAAKYGISIPNRLKKDELLEYIKKILKLKRKLTNVLEQELSTMTVVQLNSFCQLHKIELSTNIKKNELIYLFMFLIKELNLPQLNISLNDMNIKPIEFSVNLELVDIFKRKPPTQVIFLKDTEVIETVLPFLVDKKEIKNLEKEFSKEQLISEDNLVDAEEDSIVEDKFEETEDEASAQDNLEVIKEESNNEDEFEISEEELVTEDNLVDAEEDTDIEKNKFIENDQEINNHDFDINENIQTDEDDSNLISDDIVKDDFEEEFVAPNSQDIDSKLLSNESYDEEFKPNTEEFLKKEIINPYYKSKKLLNNRKKYIKFIIALIVILAAIVSVFYILWLIR